jgi:hypothetical protein
LSDVPVRSEVICIGGCRAVLQGVRDGRNELDVVGEDIPIKALRQRAYVLVGHVDLLTQCCPKGRGGIPVRNEEPEEPTFDDSEEEDFGDDLPISSTPSEEQLEAENEAADLATEAAYIGSKHGTDNVLFHRRHLLSLLPP